MNLRDYIDSLPRGGQKALADRLDFPQSYLSQVVSGHRKVSCEVACRIERETGGLVTAPEIRPDIDWSLIRGPAPQRAAA